MLGETPVPILCFLFVPPCISLTFLCHTSLTILSTLKAKIIVYRQVTDLIEAGGKVETHPDNQFENRNAILILEPRVYMFIHFTHFSVL